MASAAWVATATTNSMSAVDHFRRSWLNAASEPMTCSSRKSGAAIDETRSMIPTYWSAFAVGVTPSLTIGRRSRTSSPNQDSSARSTGRRSTTSWLIPADATTRARSPSRMRIVVPSVSRTRLTSVTIVRRIASRSRVVVSRSAIPRTASSRSARSASWTAWLATERAARSIAARRDTAARTRVASSATMPASVTDQVMWSRAIGTSVTAIVPRPTRIARRPVRKAAAKNKGTDASPTPRGSWSSTTARTAA